MFSTGDLDEIMPRLYLGSMFAAGELETLEECKVTHILTMGSDMDPKFPDKFEYKICEVDDDETSNIKKYFPEGIEFIETALESGGCVLVHWSAGVSRSSTMIIAYLMK